MNRNQRKHSSQIESHLITNAISNAIARRNQVLEIEESLMPLSDSEAGGIIGGVTSVPIVNSPVKYPPIVTAGIIYIPEELA